MKIKATALMGAMEFEGYGTGGGCMALTATMDKDFHLFIAHEGAIPKAKDTAVGIWVENDEGEHLLECILTEGTYLIFGMLTAQVKNNVLVIDYN